MAMAQVLADILPLRGSCQAVCAKNSPVFAFFGDGNPVVISYHPKENLK